MKLHFNMHIEMSESAANYFDASARVRNISKTRLVERVIKTVCEDHLFLPVLDDESQQPAKCDGEQTKSHYYPLKNDA